MRETRREINWAIDSAVDMMKLRGNQAIVEGLESAQQLIDQQQKYIGFLQSVCRSGETWDGTMADFIKRISTEGVSQ